MDHVQEQAVNGYEGGDNRAEWREMAMARDESKSERKGKEIHNLLVRMPGHLSAKGKGKDDERRFYQCPTDSGAFQRNGNWQRALPILLFLLILILVESWHSRINTGMFPRIHWNGMQLE